MTLPCVLIIATGGTLAGVSENPLATTGYLDATLSIEDMMHAVPGAQRIANCKTHTFCALGSENLTSRHLVALSRLVNSTLTSTHVDGVVITHGSDTLEETAFFIDSTYNGRKPVVVVSSLRPATALSADGPYNLMQAIALAASSSACDRGVLVTWSNRIAPALYTSKVNNRAVDAYVTPDQGCLGVFMDLSPMFYFTPARSPNRVYVDLFQHLSENDDLPKVPILYGHQDMDVEILRLVVSHGAAAGVVVACTGDGTLPLAWTEAVQELEAQRIPVVCSSRVLATYVAPRADAITAGYHNPAKARILLQLALAMNLSGHDIQRLFDPDGMPS